MSRSNVSSRSTRLAGWWLASIALASLGLSGCTTMNASDLDFSRVEGLRDAPGHAWADNFHPIDGDLTPHAVTNKGMQIERSLGIQ